MADFPHLGPDRFPYLERANPFRRRVDFDYGRYDYTSLIKLCNVPWTSDYGHVVNWKSAEARDTYFEALDGHVVELASGFTRVQTSSVRVDVPYDVALTFNYVYMRVPQLTPDEPIAHEGMTGIRTIGAWIREAVYQAPSATELVLDVDYWTTYLPHLSQTVRLMLRRGHAPAYGVSVDAYLRNPRENCSDLLTPDVSYGTPDLVANSRLVDIANGSKLLVFASTIPYGSIAGLTLSTVESGSTTPATFSDLGTRDGHQVGVSGYEWHYGGYGYAGMRSPVNYQANGYAVPTSTYLYAIDASQLTVALPILSTRLPQFLKSLVATYIIPRQAVVLSNSTITVAGITFFRVHGQAVIRDIENIRLEKGSFGYPARYADIAKLYTFPYAHLVVSDCLGSEIDVRIEDVGADPRIIQQVCPMTECLRWDIMLSGINDSGRNEFTWVNLDGNSMPRYLPGTDLARYTLELGIPTYALCLEGRTLASMDGYADAQAARQSAIVGYQSTMRSANTGKANADDSADAANANADASADTNVANVANNGACATSNATVDNNLRTSSTTRDNTAQTDLNSDAVQNIYDASNADLEYTEFATDVQLKSEAVSAIQNLVSNAIAGNPMGAVNAGVSGIVNITTSQALADLSVQNILDHQAISQGHAGTANTIHISNAADQTTYKNTANTQRTNNNVSTANANAQNSATTAKSNAARTASTAKSNASGTRGSTETNAKAALDLARTSYVRRGQSHDLDNPTAFGEVTGDHRPDALMRRVLQVRIETQSKGAIARAGDAMLRYGYAYDGYWEVEPGEWCPAGHDGCYWEASDVMLDATLIDNAGTDAMFEGVLKAGVTIWNDPAKIGGMPW